MVWGKHWYCRYGKHCETYSLLFFIQWQGKRKDFRKRYVDPSTSSLPSDGAGKSGTSLLKNDETIKNSINLAEMKIANALIERLDREISIQDINSSKNDTKCKKLVPEVADTQGTGEIMLIKGVRLQPMVRCSTTSTSNPQLCDKESKKPCMRPTIGSRLRAEFTEMDIIANSMSVAIEPDALLKHAEIYRIQAAAHIVPVDPSSEDEGGPARQRRRRKNKILQEEAWARLPS